MKTRNMTLAVLIAGLASQASTPAFAGGSEASGVPNPASANCLKKGGRLSIADSQLGQLGVCSFGSAVIEEWTLFSTKSPSSAPMAVVAYLKHTAYSRRSGDGKLNLANPASVYCDQIGGQSVIVSDNLTKGQYGLCEFSDRSSIEEWTLFSGPNAPQNQQLNQALGAK